MKRSWIKRSQIPLRRSNWIKKQRTESIRRKAASNYRLKAKPESSAEKKFKKEVRERDGYRCQYPGCAVYDLHIDVHHIAKRSQRPDLKLDTTNAICLCRFHHSWTDTHRTEAIELGLLADENDTYEKARRIA